MEHEYGHTIQSLILGPLYLIIIGIPSTLWGFLPCCNVKRKAKSISYFSFFTEKWANFFGEQVTGQRSMEYLENRLPEDIGDEAYHSQIMIEIE